MIAYITPFYAAILALVFFLISVRTLRLRRDLQIAIGDAGDQTMLRAMRVHSNFAEYVPLSLLLTFMLELLGGYDVLVHALCICLIVGRISHAYGVRSTTEDFRYRVFGMAMTFTALVGASVSVLVVYGMRLAA